jgi:hypothetical protein
LYANKSISILNAPDALIFVLPPTTPALNPGTPSDLKKPEPPASACCCWLRITSPCLYASVLSPLDSGTTFAPLFITPLPSVGIAPPSARVGTLVLTMF